ncbi:MAG: family 20 glycosylhydrolase [Kiritimatiellae bacterium]|nr:family 20 glycosylhydrolase [Kiritimatiellia bacterium]
MFWRPEAGKSDELANCGYDLVLCPMSHCYFDYNQGLALDPFPYFGRRVLTFPQVYAFDSLKGVNPESQHHILGGQCNNWTTHTSNSPVLEWKLWPRGFAIAEILWTYPEKRDFEEFSRRAAVHRIRLIRAHVNCGPLK